MGSTPEIPENELHEFEMEWHHLQVFRIIAFVLVTAWVLYYAACAMGFALR